MRVMDSLAHLLWHNGNFLGIEWNVWKAIGWGGNAAFFSRFMVQWYATERRKRVVVPAAFWWLSLAGSWMILSYAVFYRRDSVFIFANAFNWIPYLRNLMIHRRTEAARQTCPTCGALAHAEDNFCARCGAALRPPAA
jgi:lipid-A-disaccharide synthase-like uncharacterized protein